MVPKLFFLTALPILIALPFLANPSTAATDAAAATTPVLPETFCTHTVNPSYCKSALADAAGNRQNTADVYTYGRVSYRKAFSQSHKLLKMIEDQLKRRSALSATASRALDDCHYLANLNVDYLSSCFQTINTTSKILPAEQADDIHTLLSAVLTNQQTCLDGLQASASHSDESLKNGLSYPLADDTKLSSVLLALFRKGWVGHKTMTTSWKPTRTQRLFGKDAHGRLPLIMSDENRAVYESVSRRKLRSEEEVGGVLVTKVVTVSKDGKAKFSTINDAITSAPNNTDVSRGYFLIYVKAGVYQEYISIAKNKTNLMMIGDGINKTIITGDRNVVDGWTTFNSATFIVTAPNFVAVDITFRNTAGPSKHQAVALRSGADMSTFYSCSFEGYQDSLYTHSLRQFYRECDIYGTIDFIFGNGAVVLQNCNIYLRLPMSGQYNVITAQGRVDPNQNTGITIQNCTIGAADELASSNQTVQAYLGRPWKEYSRTVIMQSSIGGLINPAGWQVWSGDYALSTLYYAEYDNRGPGSNTTERVTWPGYHAINATDAAIFTVTNFISGDVWIPQTGVLYNGGLSN